MAGNNLDIEQPENRHERSDVDTRAVGKFGIALVLLCIVSLAVVLGLFRYFFTVDVGRNPVPPSQNAGARVPPQPQLEKTPVLDLQRMVQEEDQVLNSYGWVDGRNGIVRIPIDRAIDLLAQRGLPSRPQPAPQSAAAGVTVPTESGLGPKVQQEGGPLAGELKSK
jgi:hypothetical protein